MTNDKKLREISEDEKAKAVGQLRLMYWSVLQPYMKYGFQNDEELPHAIDVLIEGAIDFGKRYKGYDVPIHTDIAKKKAQKRRSRKKA